MHMKPTTGASLSPIVAQRGWGRWQSRQRALAGRLAIDRIVRTGGGGGGSELEWEGCSLPSLTARRSAELLPPAPKKRPEGIDGPSGRSGLDAAARSVTKRSMWSAISSVKGLGERDDGPPAAADDRSLPDDSNERREGGSSGGSRCPLAAGWVGVRMGEAEI